MSLVAQAQTKVTVPVPMRDGKNLATDVWLGANDSVSKKHPVLLRRTPYGRAIDAASLQASLNAGFMVVSQDVRGRGDSEGDFLPFLNDAADGPATMAWIASQAWSNGSIGTYGGSAEGIVQLMAAGEGPPALKCAMPTVPTDDIYEALYPGGAWRTSSAPIG